MPNHSIFCLLCLLITGLAPAQDIPDVEIDAKTNREILDHAIIPLTAETLEDYAGEWQKAVQAVSTKISELEITAIANGTKTDAVRNQLVDLREERSALIERTRIVANSLDAKGGDTETLRKYLAAVGDAALDATDVETGFQSLQAWLVSPEGGIELGLKILKFISILFAFWILAALISRFLRKALDKQTHISGLMKGFVNKISHRVILLIGLIVALASLGVNVGAALALIGGGAFILAFALQDSLSNFAAGIMLLIYRPFDVGDAVELADVAGSVDSVSLVSTTIRTFDNKKVLVPNRKVWGETITNITGMPTRRVDMTFGIGYDDDVEAAQAILEKIVAENELILELPAPSIHLHELADSSVNFICRPWVNTADVWSVYWAVTKRVKQEFDKAGITIPYPQREVHLHNITPRE